MYERRIRAGESIRFGARRVLLEVDLRRSRRLHGDGVVGRRRRLGLGQHRVAVGVDELDEVLADRVGSRRDFDKPIPALGVRAGLGHHDATGID